MSKSKKSRIVIRLGASYHDVSVNGGEKIDISSVFKFKGREGSIRPDEKIMPKFSRQILDDCAKRRMFG